MISKLRGRVSSAHVIALAALFVALGGTAFAAAKIGTNDIKNQAVTKPKIAKKAVTTGRIADQAVTERTLRDQAVTTNKIADLAVTNPKLGDSSVNAAKIADSSVAASELGGTTQVVSANTAVAGPGNGTVSVQCPTGTQVLSGGGGASSFLVFGVESFQSGNGWIWVARNTDAANAHTIFATAVCLNA
jgi:hypothetical protein